MNAEEARAISNKATPYQKQLDTILEVIKQVAENGLSKTYYYTRIGPGVKNELIKLGYTVEDGDDRDGYLATISW